MITIGQHCIYEGETYSHGSEVCWVDGCMVCNNGELRIQTETPGGEGEFQVDAAEAYFTPVP